MTRRPPFEPDPPPLTHPLAGGEIDGTNLDGDGDCFVVAAALVLDLARVLDADPERDVKLVHGLVLGQAGSPVEGVRYWHAWAELTSRFEHPALPAPILLTTCCDYSNGNNITMPAAVYYRLGDINTADYYTAAQARHMMVETGHYGPWPDGDE